jgi:hypothetical protein
MTNPADQSAGTPTPEGAPQCEACVRLRLVLASVLLEAGMQAHKHGCPNRLHRPAKWDDRRPCAGCRAEEVLPHRLASAPFYDPLVASCVCGQLWPCYFAVRAASSETP